MKSTGDLSGLRTLIVGASSGIGRAFALAASRQGARVALAARRTDLLVNLADALEGSAHTVDVADSVAIESMVDEAAQALGGLDAVVFTSAVVPFARVAETDVTTWIHAFSVNAIGASHVLRACLPYLADNAVVLVASTYDVGRPASGLGAYSASKAALNELLRSWRGEHPELAVIRVSIGPTEGTELLRGADRELLADLVRSWSDHDQIPAQMSQLADVADTLVSLVGTAHANPSVVSEVVHLAVRTNPRPRSAEP